ncbi:MAG: hypothetical protein ACR2JC_00770 [Chloroflexota bacterium]|nr:MAG: hypothetical protein DLM70_07125 [Chloroflexota bacterium]
MQTPTDEETQETVTSVQKSEERDGGASEIAFEQASRPNEELRMLFIGFGTGMSVGLIFLIYIIAASAHVLP